jgi:hypothetical protein
MMNGSSGKDSLAFDGDYRIKTALQFKDTASWTG